ncbi:MAG: dihydroneopterin aldolase [Synechococcus sp. BS307-5m-G38]|nr:dihydroneopterin aldolase [Synechococcus sp. BS307-5m-G38]
MAKEAIHIRELRLWAHVGVLEQERRDGQWFSLDISFWLDLSRAAAADDLASSLDYSVAIQALQGLAREIRCLTIEHFSEQVLDRLEQLYGPVPVRLMLSKCAAPVPGFDGRVAVERCRHGAP